MSFLNPLLLAGLSAVSIPIIIHLLNRRRFQKVVWAAMRFLQLSVEQNQKRMRIEDLILLILRCLLLALLALALARPAILSDTGDYFGQSKVTGVIVLDNSYSMGMSDGTSTRFEKARDTALDAVNSMPPGSATAVILASDLDDQVIPEPTFDLNLARRVIREAPLTDRATDLFPAIDQAVNLLRDRLALRREIFIITDGQAAGWRQLTEIQEMFERVKSEIKLHLILVNEAEESNLGISELRLASGLAPVNQPLRFEVRVANYGREEAIDTRVTLSVNDEPPTDEFTIDSIAPGASRSVSLFAKLRELGFHSLTARLPEDRLTADDSRTLAVRAIRQVNVLLVDGDPGDEPRDSEVYFLGHALTPVPTEMADSYFIQTTTLTAPEIGKARLDDYDAVILANVRDLADDTVDTIKQYLRRGGGLILFTGPNVNLSFYNETLLQTSQLLPAEMGPPDGDAEQSDAFLTLQDKDYTHPITAIWNDPAAGTLSSARYYRRHPLIPVPSPNIDPEADNAPEAGAPRVIVNYSDGTPAMIERPWGLGLVILSGTSVDTTWNDAPVRPSFLPLIHRCLGYIVQRQDAGLNLRVGEPFRRRINPEFLGKEATFFKPRQTDAVNDLRRVELVNGRPVLQYKQTDYAGIYEVSITEPALDLKFAAQPDGRESSLDTLSVAQRDALKGSANIIEWSPSLSLKDQVEQQRTGLEFWLPILILVLMLAGLETFLAQWFSRSK